MASQEQTQRSSLRCPSCGSEDIDTNDAGGVAACTNCGTVLEENLIVSSIEFAENSNGGASRIGQYVSSTSTRPFSSGTTFSKESREITINNGRKKISQVAGALKLGQHYIDSAHRLFIIAVARNFVQGRKTMHVVAACLYIICRREKAPHLLIDFSDILQTNVYRLGSTFLKFSRLLNMKLPVIDPSLYIHRFAAKLEFQNETHSVAMTALRLVSRMKRDWIQTGRRPSGICGAALIIAARMHGFRRTQKEVVSVLHICEETLRLRLSEFEATPSSQLTMDAFLQIDLPAEQDPPSLTKNTRKEQLLLENQANPKPETANEALTREMYDEIEAELGQVEENQKLFAKNQQEEASKKETRLIKDVAHESDSDSEEASERKEKSDTEDNQLQEVSDDSDTDGETDDNLLNEDEIAKKTAIWEELHQEFLDEQKKRIELNKNKAKPERRKRKKYPGDRQAVGNNSRPNNRSSLSQFSTQTGNVHETPEPRKKVSKKINYEALKFLQEDS